MSEDTSNATAYDCDLLVASGYAFRYPTFREGYTAVLAELS